MTRRITLSILAISLLGLSVSAQDVVIKPGDDVLAILQPFENVPDSEILFEPGYYLVTMDPSETGSDDLIRVAPGTTIRGAGSGFDPATATIIDCGYTFDSAIKIDDGVDGITVENITLTRTIDALIEIDAGAFDNTFNNVWAVKAMSSIVDSDADATFENCVFGWASGDVIYAGDPGPAILVFTNCDIFLGHGDLVESAAGTEIYLRNCILFAGPGAGSNDLEVTGGWIVVRSSVGWDPVDGDPPGFEPGVRLGRLDLNGDPDVDETNVGEDPLYVKPPGMGYKPDTMDLHLQDGSPALTAGSTSFDDEHKPTGDPTFAGSQGAAPVDVGNWSIY